jgi:glucoamylase
MLPEQIWDRADLPSEGMYFGRAAGSAQPLVWAHAEYLKLLRSVADKQVFDCISVVHDRYILGQQREHFRRYLGIFQLGRPISAVVQGGVLRIVDATSFSVVYTTDNWATKTQVEARSLGRDWLLRRHSDQGRPDGQHYFHDALAGRRSLAGPQL